MSDASDVGEIGIYIGDLPPGVSAAFLEDIFSSVGCVSNIRVFCNSAASSSAYAYVYYLDEAVAALALETLNFTDIQGCPCRIMWKTQEATAWNVYVKNLDENIDDKALYDTFGLFGKIVTCKTCNGYAFIAFETAESAELAIERVNGMRIGETVVEVGSFAEYENKRVSAEWPEAPALRVDVESANCAKDDPEKVGVDGAEAIMIPSLARMWKERLFTDAVVVCGGRKLRVHRAVLAMASPVWAVTFQERSHEALPIQLEVDNHVSFDAVNGMLRHIYTGELEPSLAPDVLPLAHSYQLRDLVTACCEEILKQVTPGTVVQVLRSLRAFRSDLAVASLWEKLVCMLQSDCVLLSAALDAL